jgi:Uma2 family endonuclease
VQVRRGVHERYNQQMAFERESDDIIVLRNISWAQYLALDRARGESPQPRMAYLDGELELVTTSPPHEMVKKLLARMVECYAEERDLVFNGAGNMTCRKRKKQAAAEPDECYFVGERKPFPDLAIEVVWTSGGIDKLEIYRRLGVREVWFWIDEKIAIYELAGDRYHVRTRTQLLPSLDLADLERRVRTANVWRQTEAVRKYRRWLRRN